MPSHDNPSPEKTGISWPGVLRTLLVQMVVLLALSGAVVCYLNWSSDAAWADFIAASQPASPGLKSRPQSAAMGQTFKGPPLYGWRV